MSLHLVTGDAYHEKTDLNVFVVVISKEGLAGWGLGYDNDKELKVCFLVTHIRLDCHNTCISIFFNLRCFQCAGRCNTIDYISQAVESKWPSESVLQSFYEQVIKGKSYENNFNKYFTNDQLNSSTTHNGTDLTRESDPHLNMERKKIIQANFSKVVMYLSEWEFIFYKDTPKYTFGSMAGNVGGALNLWAGITVVVVVEILELILRMLIYDWSDRGKQDKRKDNPRQIEPH